MKTIRTLSVSLACLFTFTLFAQENKKLDSMQKLYQQKDNDKDKVLLGNLIIQDLLYSEPEEAYKLSKEIIAISEEIDFINGIAKGYHRLGGYFANRQELDSAEFYHKKSLQINIEAKVLMDIMNDYTQLGVIYIRKNDYASAHEVLNKNVELYNNRDSLPEAKEGDFRYMGSTFHTISTAYRKQGFLQLALKNELEALRLHEQTGEELFVADAMSAIGAIEGQLNNHDSAIEYFGSAIKTYHKFNDVYFECEALLNMGISLQRIDKHNEAITTFSKGLIIAQKHGYKLLEANLLNELGKSYTELNEPAKAENYLRKSLESTKASGHQTGIENTYGNLGILYNKQNNPQKALSYFNRAIAIADSNQLRLAASVLYNKRSESFQKLGNFEKALEDFMVYSSLNDSVFNKTKSQQIEELRTIFDTEKKEQEIALQKIEIETLEQRAKISNLQRILYGTGLVLSLVILGLAFYGFRQKLKRNRLEKEKVDAELAFKKKELTTHALNLARKNETLENLKTKAKELQEADGTTSGYGQLIRTINFDLQDDNNWENFSRYFEQVHRNFNADIKRKYPSITPNELRLMALLKMNLSSKEIANILNISAEGIKKARYRLRKKLDISSDDSLQDLVLSL